MRDPETLAQGLLDAPLVVRNAGWRQHVVGPFGVSQRWAVVPAPRNAPRFPAAWGKQYGVCPNCRDRASLNGEPASMRCHRCNGLFEVAWNERYIASA